MNRFVFLSEEFYARHKEQQHTEIEQKQDRPYIQVCVEIDGTQYAVPMRSHIKHDFVLWTDKKNGCGLDFSKTVVIETPKDIDNTKKPYIRDNEFASLIGKEHIIKTKLRRYIDKYKKAKKDLSLDRNRNLCAFSTLQYFEDYI
ncbi:hypothetical protein [Anaerovibrio lipolyticus]|uniref:type III toxin-antitoxin system TenpIN family toxin n=1 Tax=Anaerovibrio lipolyticus TaxID=82374 RepID=UPI0023F25D1C|nr:hypothetical protein [Anaerovibrio lipolyticus]